MAKLTEIGGRRVPFLRWSVWRMVFGMKHLTTHWQVGDGREEALADYVHRHRDAGRPRRRDPGGRRVLLPRRA